jgi:hypothetical protein
MKTRKFGRTKFSPLNQASENLPPAIPPKYMDPGRVDDVYGISGGKLYPLINSGRVVSITLCEPGKSRGKRLVLVASLEAYLKSLETPAVAQ